MTKKPAVRDRDELIDVDEVGRILISHPHSVFRRVGRGDLPKPVKIGPRNKAFWKRGDILDRAKAEAAARSILSPGMRRVLYPQHEGAETNRIRHARLCSAGKEAAHERG